MTYTAPSVRKLDIGVGTDSQVVQKELALIDAELDAHAVLIAAAAGGAGSTLASTNIIVGNAENVATAVALSGDATLANTGAMTIANEAVTVGKMADLTRGSILSGQTANNRPAALDAKGEGKILVGDGTDLASVSVSGDITLAANGDVTIATGAVEESMLAAASTEGLHAARIARTVYDFSVDGGETGDITLGATLPDKSRVVKFWYDVITPLTSANNTATVAISIPTDDVAGLVDAIAISNVGNPWGAGLHAGIQDGAVSNISEKCTAARALTMTIAQEALTDGKIVFFAEYVVSA